MKRELGFMAELLPFANLDLVPDASYGGSQLPEEFRRMNWLLKNFNLNVSPAKFPDSVGSIKLCGQKKDMAPRNDSADLLQPQISPSAHKKISQKDVRLNPSATCRAAQGPPTRKRGSIIVERAKIGVASPQALDSRRTVS